MYSYDLDTLILITPLVSLNYSYTKDEHINSKCTGMTLIGNNITLPLEEEVYFRHVINNVIWLFYIVVVHHINKTDDTYTHTSI